MHNAKKLVIQQQRESLEELGRTMITLARLRKLIQEQQSYEPAALQESVKILMAKLSDRGRRFLAHVSILVELRCGRVRGVQSESGDAS